MTPGRPARDPLQPKPPRTMRRGLVLAVLVHILLIVGLAVSVNWKSSEPPAVEAELWSAVPKAAAPRAVEPEPDPTPVPPPAPQPAPAPPPPPPAPVREAPPPQIDPQIAIDQDKRKREEERREELDRQQEQQRQAKAKADKERQAKLDAAQRQQALKDEQDRKDKLAADRREKELEQQKADKLAQQKAQQLAQQKAAKEAQLKQERDAQTLAAQREANLKRIMGQAGATGDENARGTELRSSGPSSTYGGRVAARIKPNIVFGDDIPGNPTAEVEVRIGPDGTIIGRRLTKSSGSKEWDDAVLRAIDRTGTLPRDTDGRVPPSLVIAFRLHDL